MSDKQSNLTDKEMEDLQRIVAELAGVCVMADKHSIDRDLQKWQAYRIMKLITPMPTG